MSKHTVLSFFLRFRFHMEMIFFTGEVYIVIVSE